MKQFNRRTFIGTATAAMATAAGPIGLPAKPQVSEKESANGVLSLIRYPDRVAAYSDDTSKRIELVREADRWHPAIYSRNLEFRSEVAADALQLKVSSPTLALTRIHLRWNVKVPTEI